MFFTMSICVWPVEGCSYVWHRLIDHSRGKTGKASKHSHAVLAQTGYNTYSNQVNQYDLYLSCVLHLKSSTEGAKIPSCPTSFV